MPASPRFVQTSGSSTSKLTASVTIDITSGVTVSCSASSAIQNLLEAECPDGGREKENGSGNQVGRVRADLPVLEEQANRRLADKDQPDTGGQSLKQRGFDSLPEHAFELRSIFSSATALRFGKIAVANAMAKMPSGNW